MQELRAQIQAQIKLATTLRLVADQAYYCFNQNYPLTSVSYLENPNFQAGKNNIHLDCIDLAGDLDQLKKNIALFKKGKFGKGLADFEINDWDWMDENSKKVKAVTIFIYESSV